MTTPSAENLFALLRRARLNLEETRAAKDQADQKMEDCHEAYAQASSAYAKALKDIEDAVKVAQ